MSFSCLLSMVVCRASVCLQVFVLTTFSKEINLCPKLDPEWVELQFNIESFSFLVELPPQPTGEIRR